MKFVCPECKNDIDTSVYSDLKKDQVVECGTCGITLVVTDVSADEVASEIIDEGK